MNDTKTKSKAYRLALRHYLSQLMRYRWLTALAWTLPGVGSIFVFYVPPMIISKMIQRFDGTNFSLNDTLPYITLMGGLWLFGELLWRVTFLCVNKLDSSIIGNLYKNGLDLLTKKDPSFFQDNFSGSLTKKLLGYGRNFEVFMDTLTFSIFSSMIPFIFALFVLWQKSPLLTAVLLVSVSVMIAIIIPLARRRKKLIDQREDASNVMAGHVADVITNMPAVHAFARESDEMKHHEALVNDFMQKAKKSWDYHTLKIETTISPFYVLINMTGLILAILVGKNSAQVATVFLTFSYFGQVTRILWEFNRIYRNIENSLSDAAQFTELLLENPKIMNPELPENTLISRGEIEFDDVEFSYGGQSNQRLFKNLKLKIKAGEKVALVGPSGGGKSTFTKLLLRFDDVNSGEIKIDGTNIASMDKSHLRKSISYVPQDPQMFHRSIADNIKYGNPGANEQQVESVARKAHAHEFIKELANKYDTLVGERGTKLSGGQRQRVAIARAMLKDAPVLILDEATSALDSGSEVLIQDALWQLMKDQTAIVIAHRLSTIQKMNRIIVLDEGKIVEEGSHTQLLNNKNGLYARLWKHQSGGFLQD